MRWQHAIQNVVKATLHLGREKKREEGSGHRRGKPQRIEKVKVKVAGEVSRHLSHDVVHFALHRMQLEHELLYNQFCLLSSSL
jgi:hypothetical protein